VNFQINNLVTRDQKEHFQKFWDQRNNFFIWRTKRKKLFKFERWKKYL